MPETNDGLTIVFKPELTTEQVATALDVLAGLFRQCAARGMNVDEVKARLQSAEKHADDGSGKWGIK